MAEIAALRAKLKLVEFNEKNHLSVEAIAKKFQRPKSSVYYILSKKNLWLKRYNEAKDGRAKRFWLSENAVMDNELARWYSNLKIAGITTGITNVDLRKQVKSVAREYKIDFKPTRDWIKQFVGKHQVVFRKIDSEANKPRKVDQKSAKKAKIHISNAVFSKTPHKSVQQNKRLCKTNEKVKKSSDPKDCSTRGAQNIETQNSKRRRTRSESELELKKTNRATRDAQKTLNNREILVNTVQLQNIKTCITRNRINSENLRQSSEKATKDVQKALKSPENLVTNIELQCINKHITRRRTKSENPQQSLKRFERTHRSKKKPTRDLVDSVKLQNLRRITRNRTKSEENPAKENATRHACKVLKNVNNIELQNLKTRITRSRIKSESHISQSERAANPKKVATNAGRKMENENLKNPKKAVSPVKEIAQNVAHIEPQITKSEHNTSPPPNPIQEANNNYKSEPKSKKGLLKIKKRERLLPIDANVDIKRLTRGSRSKSLSVSAFDSKKPGEFEKTHVKEIAQKVAHIEPQITKSEHNKSPPPNPIQETNNNYKPEPKSKKGLEFLKTKKRKRLLPNDTNVDIKRLTRGSRSKSLSVSAFENSTSRVTRNYLKLLEDRHEMLLPRKRKPKLGDVGKAELNGRTRRRRAVRIDWSTDDAEEHPDAARRTRRRRKKLVVLDKPPEDLFDDSGTFEDEIHEDAIQYYDAIENDGVVEIFCTKPPCEERPKIEIHSNIQIISGSKNLMKKHRGSTTNDGATSTTTESLFTNEDNSEMSWSNLFPDLDKTLSEDELVHQINEIEFQYDPDAFKNVKIEVLPSVMTDADEYDGAEGDDELEDDDVPQSSQGQPMPPPNQMPQPPNSMQGGYRPPMAPRPSPPRGPQQNTRMPGGPRPPMNNRAPGIRPRAPMIRPRGATVGQPVRGPMRPRMNGPQNMRPGHQASPIKRDPGAASLQAKRRKVDVLTPSDKDDDDCQVICMQPKNTGLPQIESVQGASESVENSIMKLSDSITLSVRNPPPRPVVSPQKSDAKAVANVLASRGITVTASGKSKESPTKQSPGLPTALSLNGAVSIVAKNTGNAKSAVSDNLPTVDLTEDSPSTNSNNSPNKNRPGLPYRCDLCPAQYPNAMGLNKHRQTYHKTTSGMCELGVPLINIKQPGILQKLSQMGINNYIPLPSAGPEGTYALPIISTKNPGNVAALGATQMLSLGPVRAIPRPGAPTNTVKK